MTIPSSHLHYQECAARAPERRHGPALRRRSRDLHRRAQRRFLADAKIAWRDAYEMQMRAAVRPLQQAAE